MHTKVPVGEILFEVKLAGNVMTVAAIHVETGTEISLAGPAVAGEYVLKTAAIRKLIDTLDKRHGVATGGLGLRAGGS